MLSTALIALAALVVTVQAKPESAPSAPAQPVDRAEPVERVPHEPSRVAAPPKLVHQDGLQLVLAAEVGVGGMVPVPLAGGVPFGHARPFIAAVVGRFTFQVEGALELGIPFVVPHSSVAALFAVEATDTSRIELGAGVGAGFLFT